MSRIAVAIIGAGPYGLSLSAHLAARRVEHRVFGRPMQFWSDVAEAGGDRYLRTYCFGTNISTPANGFSFADYSRPRGLELIEPCSIADFAAYGHWFQLRNVPWVEPIDVVHLATKANGFAIVLSNGERVFADRVVIAIGLKYFHHVPRALNSLAPELAIHTSQISSFAAFKGRDVAVVGAGQSALEAAALLHEMGARPQLLVRGKRIRWMSRVSHSRSLWQRLKSPISSLGSGPRAWALAHFPGALHRFPGSLRSRLLKNHLLPGGAWWLRERLEHRVPVHAETTIDTARDIAGRVELRLRVADGCRETQLIVDHVIAGTGYHIDIERLTFLDPELRSKIERIGGAPMLDSNFEASAPGLSVIGPASAPSFGPLFRFVAGSGYTARVVSARLHACQ